MKNDRGTEDEGDRRRRCRILLKLAPSRRRRQHHHALLSPISLLLLLVGCFCCHTPSSLLWCSSAWTPSQRRVSPSLVRGSRLQPSSLSSSTPSSNTAFRTTTVHPRRNFLQLELALADDGGGDGEAKRTTKKKKTTGTKKTKQKRKARGARTNTGIGASSGGGNTDDEEAEWRSILAAFQLYKAAYGNLKIPQRFIVPNMSPWPRPAWGMRLGRVVSNIRATGRHLQNQPQRKQILDEMGFLWQVRRSSAKDDEAFAVGTAKSGVTLEQVYTALCTYRDLYAHTQVPPNFVVPDVDPWPEQVRQLPLGRHVASLPKMLARPANAEWAQKFSELMSLSGAAKAATAATSSSISSAPVEEPKVETAAAAAAAPPSLSSPVQEAETATASSSQVAGEQDSDASTTESPPPTRRAAAIDVRFQRVFTALKTYKAVFGDLLVPQPFCVPDGSPEWPEDTWGLRLGARVNAIRSQGTFVNNNPQRRQMLDDIGFVWSPPRTERRGRRKASEIAAEQAAAAAAGFAPPPSFASTPPTTSESAGTGAATAEDDVAMLFDGTFGGFKEFSLDEGEDGTMKPTWGLQAGRDALQEKALRQQQEAAKQQEEDYSAIASPKSLQEALKDATDRAMECGVIQGMTENNRVIKGKREKDIPWFNDDFGQDFVFDDVVEALTLYKQFYGNFDNLTETNSPDFVVPAPEEHTGFMDDDGMMMMDGMDDDMETFNVDASAQAARAIAKFEEEGDLERSGDLIASEIQRLQEELEPENDAVSAQALQEKEDIWPMAEAATKRKTDAVSVEWPEHLAGMTLGSIVSRIRDGSLEVRHLPERKAKLDKIGFDWGEDVRFIDVPFEKAMCAMYAYYLVRGDMFVYEDFVMPDEDPWPQALAGYEIGKAVKRIRELQQFLEAYHPEKVSLLRMIDFVWFPTMALSLDPDEPEMDNELLLLTAMGHPDYAKMIDIPMGLPDKIIADGPFFDSTDPKNWWRKWHNWDYVKDYWYQQGRRDNAYVLRINGYPRMAAEHEAKYGPGLFTLMKETLDEIEAGIEGKSIDEKKEILSKLAHYRQEMLGCTDIHAQEVEKTLEDLDAHMLAIMKDAELEYPVDEEEVEGDVADEEDDEYEYYDEEEGEEEDDEYEYEEEEFSIEDELGLDKSRDKAP